MEPDERDINELIADLFCLQAEVKDILDRHREPFDLSDPEYWKRVKRQAMADWRAGRVPIWRETHEEKWVFLGYENDPVACRRRDAFNSRPTRNRKDGVA